MDLHSLSKDAHTIHQQGFSTDRRESRHYSVFDFKAIDKLPDKVLLHIFSFLKHFEVCRLARVCKKWRMLAYDPRLWTRVSLRGDFGGLRIRDPHRLLSIINSRMGNTLRYVEIPFDLVTASVLHELANKCPNIREMILDFSNAMQLSDFNDLNAFPCNLRSLTICLSEVIFLEGFMRRVYQSLGTLEVLHLIGTFEQGDEQEEEVYEVINLSKIKAHTPNLRIVNLYGINFIDDTHVEILASNCIHIECLALNFCLRVKGAGFGVLVQRCKKLKTLLAQHCGLEDEPMREVQWEEARNLCEVDLTSTELSTEALQSVLMRLPPCSWLGLGYCEFFTDKLFVELMNAGKMSRIKSLDISHTVGITEPVLTRFLEKHGSRMVGFMCAGKPKLAEQFFLNVIPYLKKIRILVMGTANGWFLRLQTRVHIDQVMICVSQNCPRLERFEVQWDPDTTRFSENSSKFIDMLRLRCPYIKSLTLSDGEYYEMTRSNFERANRHTSVRTTTNYVTSLVSQLSFYKDLLFN